MSIQFINKEFEYNPNTRVTRFFGLDQNGTVRFVISRAALLKLEGRLDMPDGALGKVFERHRAHIHALANNIIRIPDEKRMSDHPINIDKIGAVDPRGFLRRQ